MTIKKSGGSMSNQGNYVTTNGIDIYYETYGEGPPLLLLHGAYGNVEVQWKNHIPFYAKHFKVIAADARGHGKTTNPTGKITGDALLSDALALIDALKLENPLIIGWSMGAIIASRLALEHPGKARAIVVGGISHIFPDDNVRDKRVKESGFKAPGEVDFEQFEQVFPPHMHFVKDLHVQGWESFVRQMSYLMLEPRPHYETEDFQKIIDPILLLIGDRDHDTPVENVVELYRLIPNAEMTVIPNADHSVCRMKPELFAQLALNFLLRHSNENE